MGEAEMDNTIRILSIDGGGIRGILPARVLQFIENKTGRSTAELFHLIAGTSTGGIIGCGLLAGKEAEELGDLYAKRGSEIFAHSLWHTIRTVDTLAGAKYEADVLERILQEQLGDTWLGETRGVELLVPTYIIELPRPEESFGFPTTRRPFLFKSWKARGTFLDRGDRKEALDFWLRDIARATSAAPTFFPPAHIQNRAGDWFAMVDGGVFANNPTMCALTAAYKLYPDIKERPVVVVSLGTGSLERAMPYAEAKRWGELRWLHPILSILMDGNADTVCYEADQVLGPDRHFRIETSTGTDPSLPYTANKDFDDE
jgi:patatin-like phospholipase/acyl hydrolase